MKITLTSAAGAQAFVLADDSVSRITVAVNPATGAGGNIAEGFVPAQERLVQATPLLRAPYQLIASRYNLKTSLTITVNRTFATIEMCLNFLATHPGAVPAGGELELQNTTPTGTIMRFLPNAVLQSVKCLAHTGASCRFQYTFIAPNPWQNTP